MEIFVWKKPTQLTVWDISPVTLLLSAIFVSLGLRATAFNFSIATLTCDRQSAIPPRCQLVERGLHARKLAEIPLDSLQQASVRKTFSGRSQSYRLVLLTSTGEIPFPRTSFQGQKYEIADRINAFLLDSRQTSLEVSQDDRLAGFLLALGIWLFGSLLWAGTAQNQCEFLTCHFDRQRGFMTLKQRNLWRTGMCALSLQNLEAAMIEASQQTKMNRWGKFVNYSEYSLILVLKSGKRFWITTYETEMLKGKQRVVEYITQKIEETAKNSPQKTLAPSALEQEITTWQDAIALSPNNAEAHYHLGLAFYRHHQHPQAARSLQCAKTLFQAAGHAQKAAEVQDFLWQSGLE